MKTIGDKNVEYDPDRKLSIVVEFVAGKITETIERMIALYRPDSLIVGTRGERSFLAHVGQAVGSRVGSVSRYVSVHTTRMQAERLKILPESLSCPCDRCVVRLLFTLSFRFPDVV